MKRSEAETIINNFLDHSLVITGKTILDLVEKLGMLPPEISVEEPDNDEGCIEEGSRSFVRNEWEDESR